MMGIFTSRQYSNQSNIKKGSASPKHGIRFFFSVFLRKIWKLIGINFIYFLVVFPLLAMGSLGLVALLAQNDEMILHPGLSFFTHVLFTFPLWMRTTLLVLSIVFYGPMKLGVTSLYHSYIKEKPVFLSEVIEIIRLRLYSSIFLGVLDIVVLSITCFNLFAVSFQGADLTASVLSRAVPIVTVMLFTFYVWMRHFTYLVIATTSLSVWHSLKNAAICVLLKVSVHLGLSFLIGIIWMLLMMSAPLITLIVVPGIIYSLSGMLTVYTCEPMLARYVLSPPEKKKEKTEMDDTSREC